MSETFTTAQVSKLTGLHPRLLQRWTKTGFITPIYVQQGPRRRVLRWTFADLVALRVAAAARVAGASLQSLREAVSYLKKCSPGDGRHPLAGNVLALDGKELFQVLPGKDQAVTLVKKYRGQGIHLALTPLLAELRYNMRQELAKTKKRGEQRGRPKGARDKAPRKRKGQEIELPSWLAKAEPASESTEGDGRKMATNGKAGDG